MILYMFVFPFPAGKNSNVTRVYAIELQSVFVYILQ